MRSYKVAGIIVKRTNVGEADRILTVFTKEQGKIHIKAKGVRKITSRRSSHVELLNHCIFNLYKGKGMPVLTEIEPIQTFQSIKTALQKTGFAYYICELIEGLCPEGQENAGVFALLITVLEQVSLAKGIDILATVHRFEVALLSTLGYWSSQRQLTHEQTEYFIENILERKLKTLQILPQLR
jgi:DNA repair protein RecO (recombination protein O)